MQHSFLEMYSMFSTYRILESEEACISFLQQHELIPKKEDTPPLCPKCSSRMYVENRKNFKIGWGWKCGHLCHESISSLKDTFLAKIKTPFRDVMAFIFNLIWSINLKDIHAEMVRWRAVRSESDISMKTSRHLYIILAEVAETVLTKNGETVLGTQDAIFDKYRETRLNCHGSYDDKLHQLLMDIKSVYPGYLKLSLNRQ